MKFYNSTHNFYKKNNDNKVLKKLEKYNINTEIDYIEVVKNEEFGFFVTIDIKEKSCINLNKDIDLPWWGLKNRYRIEIESSLDTIFSNFVEYVKDDDGNEVADIILEEKSKNFEGGEVPIFIQGIVKENYTNKNEKLKIRVYKNENYEKEKLVEEKEFEIKIIDFVLKNNEFYMDLWQHPCSWARVYNLEYFSEEHFVVIKNYLKELSKLNQKVITLIVSDFPWAGQKCFDVKENASRLYEYNIIKVRRKNGKLNLDFTNLDKYINLCFELGIKEEINLFGLIGNWHGYDFGSPLTDYNDPIRISLYDEDKKIYDYIRKKDELKEYLTILFDHFYEKGYLEITKIIGDEPSSIEIFDQYVKFLNSCSKKKLKIKYALHSPQFLENYEEDLESFSINTLLLAEYLQKDHKVHKKYMENRHKMTWYSCCFPQTFNVFIKSPLIESRLIGLYTYLFNMKGMLRWAYGIYTEDPMKDITYKKEKWTAGDMLFVYPGKNMKPLHSLREKNMIYGVQDFNLLKEIEKENENIKLEIMNKLNIKDTIILENNDVKFDEYVEIEKYKKMLLSNLKIK